MFKNNLNNIDLNNLTEESAAPNIAKVSSKNDITIMNEMMEKFEKAFSKSVTKCPLLDIQDVSIHSFTYFFSLPVKLG